MMVRQWKNEFLDNAGSVYANKRGPKPVEHAKEDALYGEIGRLKMELDWLKKVRTMSLETRMGWIDPSNSLSLVRQCALAGVSRATWYSHQSLKPASGDDLQACHLIDQAYTQRPFYGSRRMVRCLKDRGLTVNRKRVQRLMASMGLAGMAPGPNTSRKHPQNRIYPYLLRGLQVVRPNQVWSTDITYGTPSHEVASGRIYTGCMLYP